MQTNQANPLFYVNVKLNDLILSGEVDSGSDTCVMSISTFKTHFSDLELKPSNAVIQFYTNEKAIPLGYVNFNVRFNEKTRVLKFLVLPKGGSLILGRDFMSKFCIQLAGLNFATVELTDSVSKLLQKFPKVFNGKLGTFKYIVKFA